MRPQVGIVMRAMLAVGLVVGLESARADELFEIADEILRGPVTTAIGALVQRNGELFVEAFSDDPDVTLWDVAAEVVGKDVIQQWIMNKFAVFPEAAIFTPAAPVILVAPGGDRDEAWGSMAWQWADFQGIAIGRFQLEEGTWKYSTVDFFGTTLQQPVDGFEPLPWYQQIAEVQGFVAATVVAISAADMSLLGSLLHPEFRFVDEVGTTLVADAAALIEAESRAGKFEGLMAQAATVYMSPETNRAIAHQDGIREAGVSLLLRRHEGVWKLHTVSLHP